MKKKAFTLIELLAVIIILAIIALIATPIVLDVINDARKSANKSSASMVLSAARNYYAESMLDDSKKVNLTGTTNLLDILPVENRPKDGVVYINSQGQVAMALVFGNKCYVKQFRTTDIVETDDKDNCKPSYTDVVLNGADPELDSAMIPVIINNDGTLTKADTRLEWYNYTNKQWANAVLVSDEKREEYKSADAGTTIEAKYVKAYYVWVPRYSYEIFTDVENLETVGSISDSSSYANKASLINVVFEDNNADKKTGVNKGEWLTHPAFTFGNEELNGIWVGKFETTGTANAPTVLAYDSRYTETSGIQSLRSQNVSTQFATSQKINYGLTDKEASMLKNMEWGAVAYLTGSQYGQGTTEVMINNSSNYNTGCAATVAPTTTYGGYNSQTDHTEGYYAGCENEWYTTAGQKASTTGNAYGIYDMSGGAWEYVMGVMVDTDGNPASGRNNTYNSGFTGTLTYPNDGSDPSITSITGVSFPDSKYYDVYSYNTSSTVYVDRGQLGDATFELDGFSNWVDPDGSRRYHNGWNQDYAHFVSHGSPWFGRGGDWSHGAGAGVFAFNIGYGSAHSYSSFRSVLR